MNTFTKCLALLWFTCFTSSPSLAATPATPADLSPEELRTRGLGTTPLAAESIGLSMYLPENTEVTIESVNGKISFLMSDNFKSARWRMRAQLLTPDPSIRDAHEEALSRMRAMNSLEEPIKRLTNEPRAVNGLDCHYLVVERDPPASEDANKDERKLINCWLTVPSGQNTFILITIMTLSDYWEQLQPVLESSLDTVKVVPIEQLRDERQARLERGRAITKLFTQDRLEKAIHERELYRIYRPSKSGDPREEEEIGYMSIRSVEALRGEIEPNRSPDAFRSDERVSGIMVEIEARALADKDPSHTFDVLSRFWISWDRTHEAWNTRTTETHGRISRGFAQTGFRSEPSPGQPRPKLTVVNSSDSERVNDDAAISKPIPDDAYFSQVEIYLLGLLLPRDGSIKGDFAAYYYDSTRNVITQRVDRWAPVGDGTQNWILTTQPALDAPQVTQVFSPTGSRLRRVDGDGVVTEPIQPEALEKLWKSKGLVTKR